MATIGHIAASAGESEPHQAAQTGRAGESLLDRIGNTPLLRLERVGSEFPNVEFCAKAEWFNPGGSVKDRPGLGLIQGGRPGGARRAGKTIIDATGGKPAMATPWMGARGGIPGSLCWPTAA